MPSGEGFAFPTSHPTDIYTPPPYPTKMSMGHVIAGFVSLTTAVFLGVAMADGQSFALRKTSQWDAGATETTPSSYSGLGLWKDYTGHSWENALNLVYDCNERRILGRTIAPFVFIPCALSMISLLCNLLGLQSGKGLYGLVAVLISGFNFVFLCVALGCGAALYNDSYCAPSTAEIRLKDFYDLEYGLPLVVLCIFFALLNIVVLVFTGTMKDAPSADIATEPAAEPEKEA